MKILVVDDNENHRKAAQVLLRNHEVTVAGTYAEGERCLESETPDVVLTDLLVPPVVMHNGTERDFGEKFPDEKFSEMPLGTIFALLALKKGIKMVAVVTDANHHKHPASAALDSFRASRELERCVLRIGDAAILLTNFGFDGWINSKTGEPSTWGEVKDIGEGNCFPCKRWDFVLAALLQGKSTEKE